MRRLIVHIGIICLGWLVLIAPPVRADEFVVDRAESLLGFVNHKRGLAKVFIEDPLTYPSRYRIDIDVDPSLESGSFAVHYKAADVQVADRKVLQRWGHPILKAGATATPLKPSSPSRRRRMREIILSKRLLHASKYPAIHVKSFYVKKLPDAGPYTHEMKLEISMHGEKVQVVFPATLTLTNDHLTVDIMFPLKMSDFNIKPYSTLFGTIRLTDVFHVYMHLEADRRK